MSTVSDDARALAKRLLDEADRRDRRGCEEPLAVDVLRELAPLARLHASRAQNGTWYAYLVLPTGHPKPKDGRWWMYNEDADHYWTDASADTEQEALRAALHRLVDA